MIRYDTYLSTGIERTILYYWWLPSISFRPKSGSMLLYSRKKVRYRRDGYCWKKRKDGKTTREDHMKLKVQGTEVSVGGETYYCCDVCWHVINLSVAN